MGRGVPIVLNIVTHVPVIEACRDRRWIQSNGAGQTEQKIGKLVRRLRGSRTCRLQAIKYVRAAGNERLVERPVKAIKLAAKLDQVLSGLDRASEVEIPHLIQAGARTVFTHRPVGVPVGDAGRSIIV